MRAVLVLVAIGSIARAQESTMQTVEPDEPQKAQPQPAQPPQPAQQPQQPQQPQPAQQPQQPQQPQPYPSVQLQTVPNQPGPLQFSSEPTTLSAPSISKVSSVDVERWKHARRASTVGTVIGLLGAVLSLSSVALVAVTDYPCDSLDPNQSCSNGKPAPKPTDPAPLLAYIGSSTSALGFIISAAALGYQHSLLADHGADIGRGVFGVGTTLGVLGNAAVGLGYMFGATNFLNPHDKGLAVISSSLTGAGLCLLGSLLYTIDSSRMKSAWNRLGTF